MTRPAPLTPVPPRFSRIGVSLPLGAKDAVTFGPVMALPSMFRTAAPARVRLALVLLAVLPTAMLAYTFIVPPLMMRLAVATPIPRPPLVTLPRRNVPREAAEPTVKTPVAVPLGLSPPMVRVAGGPSVLEPLVSAARTNDCTLNAPVSKVSVPFAAPLVLPAFSATMTLPAWTLALKPARSSSPTRPAVYVPPDASLMVMLARPVPPVPAMATEADDVASCAKAMVPPVLPRPMSIVFAYNAFVPEPRVNCEALVSLFPWEFPISISDALIELTGASVPTVVSARDRMPLLLAPRPTPNVPVVLTVN